MTHSDWRVYVHERRLYIVRDVFRDDGSFAGYCQYAVNDGGRLRWKRCIEGVMFADIAPVVDGYVCPDGVDA